MTSLIAQTLSLKYAPIALTWSDHLPEGAGQFKPGRWSCVMFAFAGAAQGKVFAFDRGTYGCWGGGVGLGFGNCYTAFPGGEGCFHHFLSSGNKAWEQGRATGEAIKAWGRGEFLDDFMEGEQYLKTPELVETFVRNLPITDIPAKYVVFKPLDQVDHNDDLKTVTVLVNPDQLAALTVLANFGRKTYDNVIMPFVAGCQALGIVSYQEGLRDHPRAVVGLVDISARKNVRKLLGKDLFTFSMPLALFQEMEANAGQCFLQRNTWKHLCES